MKIINKLINYGLCLFVFLLPWQTRWIFKDATIKGGVWEYGRYSLYGTEILLIILLILGVIRWLMHYRRLNNQQRSEEVKNELKGVKLWIILFSILAALSILWATDKGLSWYYWIKLIEGVGLFWLITSYKLLATSSPSTPLGAGKLQLSLIGAGFIQALLGIYQFFTQSTFGSKWLGLPLIETTDLGASVVEFLDQRWLRAYGALPHPNILGGFLALTLILTIFSLWRFYQQTSSMTIIPKKLYWLTVFYWFSLGVMFLGLVVTFSRGAWLAFLAALLYLVFHSLKNKLKMEKTVLLKTAVLFILILGTFLIGFPRQLFTARLTAQGRLERYSIQERLTSFGQAKEIFKQSPIWGNGLGNYTVALQKIKPNQWVWAYQPVHNWYLLTLGELGVMGLLLLLILLFHFFKSAGAASRSLLILLLTIGLFDHYLWSLYFGLIFVWLILALTKKHETTG